MIIDVPKEVKDSEFRVALTPEGASEMAHAGHRVLVQDHAGDGSNIPQERYTRAGAEIVPTAAEVWAQADMIMKVKEPIASEYELLGEGQILFTYLHLAASKELTQALIDRKVARLAYETVQLPDGRLPLLAPMSEGPGGWHRTSRPGSWRRNRAAVGSSWAASRGSGRPRCWCWARAWPE